MRVVVATCGAELRGAPSVRGRRGIGILPHPSHHAMIRLPAALLVALLLLAGCRTQSVPPQTDAAPPAMPALLARAAWGAAPAAPGMRPHTPSRITIHHTATRHDLTRTTAQKVLALQQFSQRADVLGDGRPKPAWADIPYHFYIGPDGLIAEARNPTFEGDSNTSYDLSGHVQVVLEGNFEEEEPTAAQLASLTALVRALAHTYGVGADALGGHLDQAPTLCPGRALYARLPELRRVVALDAR
jgi:hypothetical protein